MSGEQRLQKTGLFINKQIIKGGQQPQVNNQFFNNQPQNNQVEFLNQKWKICNPGCNRQSVELSSIMDQSQNQNESITFIFNDRDIISINKQKLVAKGLIQVESQTYDLSYLSSSSRIGCESVISYCFSGFAELNSEDFPIFMMACFQLTIEQPFIMVNTFLKSKPVLDLKLNNSLILYKIEQGITGRNPDSIHSQVFLQLSSYYAKSNPYFFQNKQNSHFEKWLLDLEEEEFIRLVPQNAVNILFQTSQDCNKVTFDSVIIFFELLKFFYSMKFPKEKQQNPEQIFSQYFNEIKPKLVEEDIIKCLQFLPKGENSMTKKFQSIIRENQELRLRESAFIDVIISSVNLNIQDDTFSSKIEKSMEIISGKQFQGEIKFLVQKRIEFQNNQNPN